MRPENHNRVEESAYARLATRNHASNVAGYIKALTRQRSDAYVVLPNGTVEFIR